MNYKFICLTKIIKNNVLIDSLEINFFLDKLEFFFLKSINLNKNIKLSFLKTLEFNYFDFFWKITKIIKTPPYLCLFYNFFYTKIPMNNLIFYNKKSSINIRFFLKNLIFIEDFFLTNHLRSDLNFFSNKYLINFFNLFYFDNFNFKIMINSSNFEKRGVFFNNYYPVFHLKNKAYTSFFKNLKSNLNLNYLYVTNKIVLNFFEYLFKKNVCLSIVTNKQKQINNNYLNIILQEYRFFQPQYFKNFLFSDFLKILWYSFFFKDLKLISDWVSKFMETLNFKNHKKFVNFFQNFLLKYSSLFINNLGIKGFFFDIRGKVGVTGSSKKRHLCFKFGSLRKSSKNFKLNYNQNLVRTYSGVLGLTYIICY